MDSPRTSARACRSCREGKRKCTKEVPRCSLCLRNGKPCHYDHPSAHPGPWAPPLDPSAVPSPSPQWGLASSAQSGPAVLSTAGPELMLSRETFPTSFFLDIEAFNLLNHGFDRSPKVPKVPIQAHGGDITDPVRARYHVDIYFGSTHTFFPIVSRLRLYQEIGSAQNPSKNVAVDTQLLLRCMHLNVEVPENTVEPSAWGMYQAAKDLFSRLEASNVVSLRSLQAALLIALYEISNAIYPAAYLTVGHCARLGHVLGIHSKRSPQKLIPPQTSADLEERRRTWWAVIILDRYVNLGGVNRPFACEDSRPETHLPIDDRSWDHGDLAIIQPLAVSSSTTVPAPPFARTCQAAHLLSQVLRHMNDADTEPDFRYQEALQINRTLQAFCSTLLVDANNITEKTSDVSSYLLFGPAMALGYGALLTLYSHYSCAEHHDSRQLGNPNLVEMQRNAMSSLLDVCGSISQLANRIRTTANLGGMLKTSPLLSNCLYEAGANYLWRIRDAGEWALQEKVAEIEDALGIMGTRWRCAREYLQLFEAYKPESFAAP